MTCSNPNCKDGRVPCKFGHGDECANDTIPCPVTDSDDACTVPCPTCGERERCKWLDRYEDGDECTNPMGKDTDCPPGADKDCTVPVDDWRDMPYPSHGYKDGDIVSLSKERRYRAKGDIPLGVMMECSPSLQAVRSKSVPVDGGGGDGLGTGAIYCPNCGHDADFGETDCECGTPFEVKEDAFYVALATIESLRSQLEQAEADLAAERARIEQIRGEMRTSAPLAPAHYDDASWEAGYMAARMVVVRWGESLSTPVDVVVERCRLYMADFMPDDDGEPCLGIRGQFKSVAMNDECWLVRRKGAREDGCER